MKALITGATGQDGYWLTSQLCGEGYDVHCIVRRNSRNNLGTLRYLPGKFNYTVHYADVTDAESINNVMREVRPDEIYHLAAMSFVGLSWTNPETTMQINTMGTLNMLKAFKEYCPEAHFYHASSSEMYGRVQGVPQEEKTPFYPRSPYGISKLAAHWLVKNYRESYGLFAANGICFNHESFYRGPEFVTKKIAFAAGKLWGRHCRVHRVLELGNLDSKRDFGHAGDYVQAMRKILRHNKPDDFVIATGETHSVREFVELAFKFVDIDIRWVKSPDGDPLKETGVAPDGELMVRINPAFFRPAEVDLLIGNAAKAEEELGWKHSVGFKQLVREMVEMEKRLI